MHSLRLTVFLTTNIIPANIRGRILADSYVVYSEAGNLIVTYKVSEADFQIGSYVIS